MASFNPNDQSTGIRALFAKNPNAIHPERTEKAMLKADLNTLQNDPAKLGKTDAQMANAVGQTQRAANAGANAQIADVNAAALAGQGFQQDAFKGAVDDISTNATQATVVGAANEHKLNDAIISSEKNRIRAQLSAEREKKKEKAQFWANLGIAGVTAVLTAVGGPAGLAAGMGLGAANGAMSSAQAVAGAPVPGDGDPATDMMEL